MPDVLEVVLVVDGVVVLDVVVVVDVVVVLDVVVELGDVVDGAPEAAQLTVGKVLLPLGMIVTPKVLPLPFGLAIIFRELGQVAVTLQVEMILAG